MTTDNFNFKNFRIKKNYKKIKKDFELLIKENNTIIKSLSTFYKNSYTDKKIQKFNEIVGFLNDIEKHFNESGINYRKDYLRPIIDILFEEEIKKNTLFKKTIENDLDIYFTLASRIGKDFLASPKKIPDHVNEPQTTELMLRIAKKNKKKDVIFGGAYIGDMAIPVSKLFPNEASSKKLHCFEIDKSPLKLLKKELNWV